MMPSIHCGEARIFTVEIAYEVAGQTTMPLFQTAKDRMNSNDPQCARAGLHHFRISGLWTGCTRLISGKLQRDEFR